MNHESWRLAFFTQLRRLHEPLTGEALMAYTNNRSLDVLILSE